jgi:ADP-ribosylarginine hydrolase
MHNGENIEHAIMHSMLGDIIGFGNGKTEFNDGTIFNSENFSNYAQVGADYSNQLVLKFLFDGGFSTHPKPDWRISDDTIMLMANCKGIIQWKTDKKNHIDDLMISIKKEYMKLVDDKQTLHARKTFVQVHNGGITTTKNLIKLLEGEDYMNLPYDDRAGGSGGSMRSAIFGVIFWHGDDILKLIRSSIESTLMTHPNATAFLGSLVVALFASYALQGDEIHLWPPKMIALLESPHVDTMIRTLRPDIMAFYERDKLTFLEKWKNYYEERFHQSSLAYKKSKAMMYASERSLFYHRFAKFSQSIYPGAGGDDSVIIAFDCLADCDGSVDKICTYSMLHVGDSDTTGAICGFLYGLVYGTSDVSNVMLGNIKVEQLPEVRKIIKIIKTII